MAGSAVVLHEFAHDRALGVPHRETATQLGRERQEIEFDRQLAMIALLSLSEPVKMLFEGRLALPRRSVDALQDRTLLVAAPIRRRHLLEGEMAESRSTRNMRSETEIDEIRGVPVEAHRLGIATNLRSVGAVGSPAAHAINDLALVRLVGEQGKSLFDGNHRS